MASPVACLPAGRCHSLVRSQLYASNVKRVFDLFDAVQECDATAAEICNAAGLIKIALLLSLNFEPDYE